MLLFTVENIQGKRIKEYKGMVRGATVRSKHIGKDFLAGFRNLVGGEITEYTDMLNESRNIAIGRMIKDARDKGANAIIGIRLATSQVMQGASEMIAYGTAVVLEDEEE